MPRLNFLSKPIILSLFAGLGLAACTEQPFTTGYNLSNVSTLFAQEQFENSKYYTMAYKYHHGLGVPKNHQLAVEHYKKAIEINRDTRAMNELGTLLITGSGIERNPKLGFSYITSAANRGNSASRFNLGLAYYYGFYLVQDRQRGLEFIYTAAKQGNVHAQSFVAEWMHREAKEHVEKDPVLRNYFNSIINKGMVEYYSIVSKDSKYNNLWERFFDEKLEDRVTMLSDIMALESDCIECKSNNLQVVARKLNEIQTWREQSDNGNVSAMYNLGLAYLDGNGVPKEEEEGARLIIKSADAGYIPAQYALGTIFLEGNGVVPNRSMAYSWFILASQDQQGYRESTWALEMLEWMESYIPQGYLAVGQEWATNWEPYSEWYNTRK
jgi:hypothetical protein